MCILLQRKRLPKYKKAGGQRGRNGVSKTRLDVNRSDGSMIAFFSMLMAILSCFDYSSEVFKIKKSPLAGQDAVAVAVAATTAAT